MILGFSKKNLKNAIKNYSPCGILVFSQIQLCIIMEKLPVLSELQRKFGGSIPSNPRGFPVPAGTGIHLSKALGKLREWGQSVYQGFLGKNPQKSPIFGDGDGARHCKSFQNTSGKGTDPNFWGFQRTFWESQKTLKQIKSSLYCKAILVAGSQELGLQVLYHGVMDKRTDRCKI